MSDRQIHVSTKLGSTRARIEDESELQEVALFSAYGELDLHVAPELQDRIDAAVQNGAEVVIVDLSKVTFVDSMALGVLVGAVNRLRRGGRSLRLVVPSPELRRIFEITHLDRVFTLDWTREEALAQRSSPL